MANYKKSFNFRNGVQVDDNNFIVNANGLVGIGTSIPTEVLDVRGNLVVSGITTTNELYVTGVSTLSGNVLVGTGVTIFSSLGIVSATSFRGDGTQLTGIDGSKWKVDAIAGLTTMSDVGIGTTDPVDKFQVGENPVTGVGVGIDSRGQAYFSGITTAGAYSTSGFVKTGDLNVTGVSTLAGTLDVDGDTQVDDLNVAGVATFSSLIDANNRLDVVGGANIDQINVSGVSTFTGIVTTGTDLYVGGDLYVKDDIEFDEVTARIATFTGTLDVSGNIDADGTLDVDGDTQLDDLNVAGVATFGAAVKAESWVQVDGELFVASNIKHLGDTDTYIEFTADKLRFLTGGKEFVNVTQSGASSVVINEQPDYDCDFRVEGISDEHLIFTDAVTDKVGIGSAIPKAKLDVNGTLNVAGVTTFNQDVNFPGAAYNIHWDQPTSKFKFDDSAQLVFGSASGGDMKLFHQSGNSTIRNETGQFRIAGNDIRLQTQNHSEDYLLAVDGGSVSIFYNDVKRLETSGIGITVTGITSTTDLYVTGLSTYIGVTTYKSDVFIDGTLTAGVIDGGTY